MKEIVCGHCGKKSFKYTGAVNRANKRGDNLYCNRECSSLGRRDNKPLDEKREEKRLYDKEYRRLNHKSLKVKQQSFNKSEAGRAMQKRNREKMKDSHLTYCRTPEYRKWKKEYDKNHLAKKHYGEYFEAYLLIKEISDEVDNRAVKQELQLTNKTQIRRRNYEKAKRSELERSPLGNS